MSMESKEKECERHGQEPRERGAEHRGQRQRTRPATAATTPRTTLRLLLLLRRRVAVGGAGAWPARFIKSEQFDAISDYLIPKALCGRLLTLRKHRPRLPLRRRRARETRRSTQRNRADLTSEQEEQYHKACERARSGSTSWSRWMPRGTRITELERESSYDLGAAARMVHHRCESCSATAERGSGLLCRRCVEMIRSMHAAAASRRRRRHSSKQPRELHAPPQLRRRCAAGTSPYFRPPLLVTHVHPRIAGSARRRARR